MTGRSGTSDLAPDEIARRFDVSRESLSNLELYAAELRRWNRRINLVAPSTIDHLWSRHIGDSLQLAELIPDGSTRIVDVGSGAGLPGLVLAIALAPRGATHVHLVESNAKKCAFLREAIRLTAAPATVHTCRIESIDSQTFQSPVTHVTARAFAPLPRLLALTEKLLANGAVGLFLKGQDVDSELTDSAKCWRIDAEKRPSRTEGGGTVLIVKRAQRVSRPS